MTNHFVILARKLSIDDVFIGILLVRCSRTDKRIEPRRERNRD